MSRTGTSLPGGKGPAVQRRTERDLRAGGRHFDPVSIDRLFTLYCSYPISKLLGRKGAAGVPILMYHSVSDSPEETFDYYKINTPKDVFRAHMRYLYGQGYSVVTPGAAWQTRSLNGAPAVRYAALTFDDGYEDFYTDAFPVLREFGFTATVYLPAGFIGKKGEGLKGKAHLNWEQIREMSREGICFGSHTVTHRELEGMEQKEIFYELSHSKAVIEDHIQAEVDSFSYPFAFPEANREFARRLEGLLELCGYKNGVTTRIGVVTREENRYFMSRLPVSSRDDEKLLRAKLESGYNWLHGMQYLFKLSKHILRKGGKPMEERGGSLR